MTTTKEELFEPALLVLEFVGGADKLSRLNNRIHDLTTRLCSHGVTSVRRFTNRLQIGTIWVNYWGQTDVSSTFDGMAIQSIGVNWARMLLDHTVKPTAFG